MTTILNAASVARVTLAVLRSRVGSRLLGARVIECERAGAGSTDGTRAARLP